MIKYKLSYFGLNKQSLKRKITKHTNKKIINLLNKRGTIYYLSEIKEMVTTLYNMDTIKKNNQLSIYYYKKNRQKFNNIIEMIDVEEKDNLNEKIQTEIKYIYNYSIDNYINIEEIETEFINISKKYSVSIKYVEDVFNNFNKLWVKNNLNIC